MCEDRNTAWPRWQAFGHAVPEGLLHERVQAAGRLVEDQQVRPAHQAGDEQELLPDAPGVSPDPLGRIQLEAVGSLMGAVLAAALVTMEGGGGTGEVQAAARRAMDIAVGACRPWDATPRRRAAHQAARWARTK